MGLVRGRFGVGARVRVTVTVKVRAQRLQRRRP